MKRKECVIYMAEVRKKKKNDKYNISELDTKKDSKEKKNSKIVGKKGTKILKKKNTTSSKNSLWVRFRIFCHGVKSEVQKVHWPGRSDMMKYSVATIFFVVFCSLFFYLIDILFAFVQSLFK